MNSYCLTPFIEGTCRTDLTLIGARADNINDIISRAKNFKRNYNADMVVISRIITNV